MASGGDAPRGREEAHSSSSAGAWAAPNRRRKDGARSDMLYRLRMVRVRREAAEVIQLHFRKHLRRQEQRQLRGQTRKRRDSAVEPIPEFEFEH